MGRTQGILTVATVATILIASLFAPIERPLPKAVVALMLEPGFRFVAYMLPFFVAHIGVYTLASALLLLILLLDCNVAVAMRKGGDFS